MQKCYRFLSVLLAAALFAACNTVDSADSAPSTFIKVFGGSGDEEGWGVRQTSDGGYVIVGTTNSLGFGGKDVYLIKTDAAGNQQWAKTYGAEGDDEGRDLQQTSDGGYIVIGSTLSPSIVFGSNDMFVIRTDASGNTIWTKHFGGDNDDFGVSVEQTRDGGYVAGGTLGSPLPGAGGKDDFWVVKLTSDGNLQWHRPLGGVTGEVCRQVRQTLSGGYLAAGIVVDTKSPSVGMVSSAGARVRDVKPIIGSHGPANAVFPMPDGRPVVAGYTENSEIGGVDSMFVFRLDSNAINKEFDRPDHLWGGNFGRRGGSQANDIEATNDGGYVLFGFTGAENGGRDFYLVKIDSSAKLIWSNTFGQDGDDVGHSVRKTSDGGYIMVGTARSFLGGTNGNDIMLVKVDPRGNL